MFITAFSPFSPSAAITSPSALKLLLMLCPFSLYEPAGPHWRSWHDWKEILRSRGTGPPFCIPILWPSSWSISSATRCWVEVIHDDIHDVVRSEFSLLSRSDHFDLARKFQTFKFKLHLIYRTCSESLPQSLVKNTSNRTTFHSEWFTGSSLPIR